MKKKICKFSINGQTYIFRNGVIDERTVLEMQGLKPSPIYQFLLPLSSSITLISSHNSWQRDDKLLITSCLMACNKNKSNNSDLLPHLPGATHTKLHRQYRYFFYLFSLKKISPWQQYQKAMLFTRKLMKT